MSCPFCLPTGERSNRCLHPVTVEEAMLPKNRLHRVTERLQALRSMIARLEETRADWCEDDRQLHKRLVWDERQENGKRLDLVRQVVCGHRPRAS